MAAQQVLDSTQQPAVLTVSRPRYTGHLPLVFTDLTLHTLAIHHHPEVICSFCCDSFMGRGEEKRNKVSELSTFSRLAAISVTVGREQARSVAPKAVIFISKAFKAVVLSRKETLFFIIFML